MDTSSRDPSILSISSGDPTGVIMISSSDASSRHSTPQLPTAATLGPIPNAPFHLVNGNIISWATSDGTNPPVVPTDLYNGSYDPVLPHDDRYQKYLEQVGTYVAKRVFGYTGTPYFMDGLPTGYSLYCHHSQPKSNDKPRTDLYLYGPKRIGQKTKMFRSPNEFTMHAVWLMGGGSNNPSLCKCIRCGTLNSQIDINNRYKLKGKRHKKHHH
ncbi:unnamed protein product [Rhizoctonia solani]|uniref:Cryptic loci regulator 2 N-terminal domain-containing protein n=1 Tax=Rhizoctonia solani TaxID=456999 RepID=A0A8H3GT76_9AGAM|nr:unnamed protein product [Rhizoctonia solani]